MMDKRIGWATAGFSVGVGLACVPTIRVVDPTHCTANDGDTFCEREHPDGAVPFCTYGTKSCDESLGITDPDVDGCVAERPPDECYSACGGVRPISEDPDCNPSTSNGSGTSSGGGAADTTAGGGATEGEDTINVLTDGGTLTVGNDTGITSTTGMECQGDADCDSADAPFCDEAGNCVSCDGMPDADAACAEQDATNPVCSNGACVQCTAVESDACDGQTPICNDAENACQACTEHAECPGSACHLDGADVGACFDEVDVQNIANVAQLNTALSGLGANDQAVLMLAAGTYGTSIDISSSAEVAILGNGSSVIAGDGGLNAVELIGSTITYFQGVEIANIAGNGVNCSGSSLWLDDSEVRNNSQVGLDISGGCNAHLRRTAVRMNSGGGVDTSGGELRASNTVVGLNGGLASQVGGIRVAGTDVAIVFSTIAGNQASTGNLGSIACSGGASGEVRNAVVSGAGGSTISGCVGVMFGASGVDTSGLGGTNNNVGGYNNTWFASPATGDFRLSATGETAFMDIAMWQDGDPETDFEGDPIPTDMASFPGYDQP